MIVNTLSTIDITTDRLFQKSETIEANDFDDLNIKFIEIEIFILDEGL